MEGRLLPPASATDEEAEPHASDLSRTSEWPTTKSHKLAGSKPRAPIGGRPTGPRTSLPRDSELRWFCSSGRSSSFITSTIRRWDGAGEPRGGVEIHEIDFHHLEILREPHVRQFGKTLAECVTRVSQRVLADGVER